MRQKLEERFGAGDVSWLRGCSRSQTGEMHDKRRTLVQISHQSLRMQLSFSHISRPPPLPSPYTYDVL